MAKGSGSSVPSPARTTFPNVPMYLVIHTAIGGIGGGDPDPATFPQTFEVDYVRITQ